MRCLTTEHKDSHHGISSQSACFHLEEKWEALAVMATNGDEDSAKWLYVRTGGPSLNCPLKPFSLHPNHKARHTGV